MLAIVMVAGLVVPVIVDFFSSQDIGEPYSEKETLQTAMDAMMADKGITEVQPSSYAIQDWTTYPIASGPALGLVPLSEYLKTVTTEYFYCWDTTGLITQQEESVQVRCSQRQ